MIFRSMAPLYPPGLDENGAVANLLPASWICSKNESRQGTIDLIQHQKLQEKQNPFHGRLTHKAVRFWFAKLMNV